MTVKEVGGTPHAADFAVITVEVPLGRVVLKEVAFQAAVLTKCCPTAAARGLNWLLCAAQGTDNFTYICSDECMGL